MAEIAGTKGDCVFDPRTSGVRVRGELHPAWARLMQFCAELGHGEIEKLKIQDGVPVIADVVREKVKFT